MEYPGQPQLIDNVNKTLRDDLVATIRPGSRVSIAAASFSIYAFQELREQLKDIEELRFIFTSPSFVTEKTDKQRREFYIPRLNRERDLFGSEFEIKLRNELSLKAVAKECAEWIRRKACFKSNSTNESMMGFINVDDTNYMPVTGFTTVDLGCERGNNAYQFIQRTPATLSRFYLNLFNQVWNDSGKLQTVTEQMLDNITNAYKENASEFIYFVTLYNIFNEFLEDISEDELPNEATGFRTKVLMLSATPVNNRFNDLRNQLALAYEGDSSLMDAQLKTSSSLDDIFRQAQTAFNRWSKLPAEERTTKTLLEMLSFDFFEVLDSVTIARSRKHIEQYYDTSDIGKFPERLKPISRAPKLTDLPTAVSFNDIFVSVSELNLAIYTPSDFILPSKLEKYMEVREDRRFGNLSRSGRERGIRQLMSINMLKRLESSVNSFRLTLERIKKYIEATINAIDNLSAKQSPSMVCDYDFSYGLDFDEREDTVFIGNRKTKIALEDMDYVQWRGYLAKDLENLNTLLFMLEDITPEHDSKLQMLIGDIRDKFANPINGDNRKIIVFTAFSDTAQYLYDNIAPVVKALGSHIGIVSGDHVGTSLRDVKSGQHAKGMSLRMTNDESAEIH